ncbi:MAG: HAMP domain-containing sensor histidine kinase [Acidimicrobiia bacterium]
MNPVFARQLRRLGLDADTLPDELTAWRALLARVNAFYHDADKGRYLLERAMDISSREMQNLNQEIEALSAERVERTEQHYHLLFDQTPVATLEVDFCAVVDWIDQLQALGVEDMGFHLAADRGALDHMISLVRVVDCNQAAAELWRVPERERLLGAVNPHSPINASAALAWRRQFEAIWAGETAIRFEFEAVRADGATYAGLCQWTAPVIGGKVDHSGVLVVIIDITERFAAEDRMRQLVVSKDEFLASVSHELRTPLTSVLGYADLLRREETDPEEQRAILGTIADQATDLANIVEDLLVGARAELGQLVVNRMEIDLVDEVGRLLTGMPLAAGVAFEVVGNKPIALGDGVRVRQIMRNLLSNAERYGGATVAVRVESDGDRACIAVRDDGPPLNDATAAQVFDRYYRHRGEVGQPGSVGIGLTISRDLARLMGGDLTYRHEDGWTVFELSLPVVLPRYSGGGAERSEAEGQLTQSVLPRYSGGGAERSEAEGAADPASIPATVPS